MRTERKFKVDFIENKASNKKFLFYIFHFFFRVESPPFRLYHPVYLLTYAHAYRYVIPNARVVYSKKEHRVL